MARDTKMKSGNEIEQERFRVTINFSREEFEIFKQASDMLKVSVGKLIKESLLTQPVTDFLKVLVANKENIYKVIDTYNKGLQSEEKGEN